MAQPSVAIAAVLLALVVSAAAQDTVATVVAQGGGLPQGSPAPSPAVSPAMGAGPAAQPEACNVTRLDFPASLFNESNDNPYRAALPANYGGLVWNNSAIVTRVGFSSPAWVLNTQPIVAANQKPFKFTGLWAMVIDNNAGPPDRPNNPNKKYPVEISGNERFGSGTSARFTCRVEVQNSGSLASGTALVSPDIMLGKLPGTFCSPPADLLGDFNGIPALSYRLSAVDLAMEGVWADIIVFGLEYQLSPPCAA